MGKKQKHVSIKLIITLLFIYGSLNVKAQNGLTFNNLTIDASLRTQDSVMTIVYQTNSSFKYLLWAGDFVVSAIISESDVSGTFLGSPIVNEIYFVVKKPFSKQSNGFFTRSVERETNLANYILIYKDHPVVVKLKINNSELFEMIKRKKVGLRVTATLIEYSGVYQSLYLNQQVAAKLSQYASGINIARKPVIIENIKWKFGSASFKDPTKKEWFIPEEFGDLSKDIYIPEKFGNNDLILPSVNVLYQFANKIYLRPKIKIIR